MVIILILIIIGIIWLYERNGKRTIKFATNKTARLFVDELFTFKGDNWMYTGEHIYDNKEMQNLIEEIKDAGSQF